MNDWEINTGIYVAAERLNQPLSAVTAHHAGGMWGARTWLELSTLLVVDWLNSHPVD